MSGAPWREHRPIGELPGYRRVLRVEPGHGAVLAMLEDDLHRMAVRLRHDGKRVLAVEPLMDRVPWTVCPGAADVLVKTFTDVAIEDVTARRDKRVNCTHLHDLAVIGAAHVRDDGPVEYRIFVSDPREVDGEGERRLEIFKDDRLLHRWLERGGRFTEPAGLSGFTALTMRGWIAGLDDEAQEAARLLQWAALIAHGRTMTDERRRGALGVSANCFTMQPERVEFARMAGGMHDFSTGGAKPLEGLRDRFEAVHGL